MTLGTLPSTQALKRVEQGIQLGATVSEHDYHAQGNDSKEPENISHDAHIATEETTMPRWNLHVLDVHFFVLTL